MSYENKENVMPITFSDELFIQIAEAANKENLSFNEFVIQALQLIILLKKANPTSKY